MGSLIVVTLLTVPIGDVELAADALWAAGAAAVEERPGPTVGTAMLVADVGPDALRPGWTVEQAAVDDGLDGWRAHARPWVAGPFVVRPPWVAAPGGDDLGDVDDLVDLVIDPGAAFGSGSHPTTRLVLAALGELVRPGSRVLDVGCGSGVLAVGAARLGAGSVDAVDIDPAAVEATLANARANHVAVRMVSLDASGETRYDVVVANIGAATLRDLAPQLAALGSRLVLSGLLDDQTDDVVAVYTGLGCVESARTSDDGWVAVVLRTTA